MSFAPAHSSGPCSALERVFAALSPTLPCQHCSDPLRRLPERLAHAVGANDGLEARRVSEPNPMPAVEQPAFASGSPQRSVVRTTARQQLIWG